MRNLMIVVFLSLVALLWAQEVMNPFAPTEATEPIVSASPSGGMDAGTYVGRAQEVAGAPPSAAGPEMMPVEAPPDLFEGARMGPGSAGFLPTPTPTPFVRYVKVVGGKRIRDPVCGTLLEDVDIGKIPENIAQDKFFDDGTHGDAQAGDEVYSNIEYVEEKFICYQCAELRRRYINALLAVDSTEPRAFYRLLVSSDEHLSQLPINIDLEEDRDRRITTVGWRGEKKYTTWVDYLNVFRVDPKDPLSDFYPPYVPNPPKFPPKYGWPSGFNPVELEQAEQGEGGSRGLGPGGGPMEGAMGPMGPMAEPGVYGEAEGAQMSRYYK